MRPNPKVAMAVGAMLALAAATSCGSTGSSSEEEALDLADPTPAAVVPSASLQSFVQDSADRTDAVETFAFALSVDVRETAGGDEVTVLAADGVVDDASGQASLSATFAGLDALGGGAGGLDGMLGSLGEPTEMVVDGSTLYVRGGVVGVLTGDGTGWVSLPAMDGQAMGMGLSADAASEVVAMLGDAGDVTELGVEVVDGVDATHLRVDVDEKEIARRLPVGGGAVEVGDLVATVDVWIGSDGIVRRMVVEAGDGAGAPQFVLRLDLRDLGDPVEVVVPDAANVTAFDAATFGGLGELLDSIGD